VSYALDVNILLYASDESNIYYKAARSFLEARAADPDLLCLTWPTLFSYMRISTHPRIFARPLSPEEALRNVETLLSLPRVRVLTEGDEFLLVYRNILSRLPVRGNLVPDAHLTAVLLQHGITRIYTKDADFRKFDFLEVKIPF
jgi:toxin-antitoxin system PIN domain toxin